MKKTLKTKTALIALLSMALIMAVGLAVFAAVNGSEREDATLAIEAAFSSLKVGETQTISSDGYIGIPLKITTYYDSVSYGVAKSGYNGTNLAIYVVNTRVERVGMESDVNIISDLLERGYIVSVLDYQNHAKAVTPNIDWSTQTIRVSIMNGTYFTDTSKISTGTYESNHIIPAGYSVSESNIFWEADKHGADGTLEKIVENWNTDFRGWYANKVIYWLDADGMKKTTQVAFDGTSPVWYSDSAAKNVVSADSPDAKYVKAKHTLALDVTDCVGPDGTPIDLNLYMHIVYPVSPEKEVPIAVLASSTEYLSTASTGSGVRPQHNGFLFNGYAGATFDYLYQPMAQKDYYTYYDGRTDQGAVTGDRMNYGLHLYNDKKINTAAMRYLRYLAFTESETYRFDTEAIGVFGNSKGGWFTFLGEAEVREYTVEDTTGLSRAELEELIDTRINAYTSKRQFVGHRDESRYQNGCEGYTLHGITIDAGELQPWLTYEDENGNVQEILGHANWIYASNGSQYEDITEGHAPVFCALHMQDDFTTSHNSFAQVTYNHDIPSLYVIVDLGHTFAYGPDYHLGFDTYQAMFDFAGYYLKGDAVKVIYTDPVSKTGNMPIASQITIKFSGAVSESEISKVSLVSSDGITATGSWSAIRGNTEWTFTYDELLSDKDYTLTVPADIKGDNGKEMGTAYTAVYHTESEDNGSLETINTANGTYFVATVTNSMNASDARIRFHVTNDAANVVGLYEVTDYNAQNPDSSSIGSLIAKKNLKGAGYYEFDVSKYVLEADSGDTLVFFMKNEKEAKVEDTYTLSFSNSVSGISVGNYVRASVSAVPDGSGNAVGIYVNENVKPNGQNQYKYEQFYANLTTAFSTNNLFGSSALTAADYGRKYQVTMRVYDTDSRTINLAINGAYDNGNPVHDLNTFNHNYVTTPGEWMDISFEYVVYEHEYGDAALQRKTLTVLLGATGKDESLIYIDSITVTETVTDVEVADDATLAYGNLSEYKKAENEKPFSIGNNYYDSFASAMNAAVSGNTIKLHKNYTLTNSDDFSGWCSLSSVTVDLNGYSLYSEDNVSVIHASATSVNSTTTITLKNGNVYLTKAPLVTYKGSTSSGKGKVFNINLESLNIYNSRESRINEIISASSIESASGATVNISMTDCNIDYRLEYNVKNNFVTMFTNGDYPLAINYSIKGGEIFVDDFGALTLVENFKNLEFVKNGLDNYTVIVSSEGKNIPAIPAMRDGKLGLFKVSETKGEYLSVFTIQDDANVTNYGIVPEAYENVETYPFVLFDKNGNFLGAYSKWAGISGSGGVLTAARNHVVNAWNGTSYGTDPNVAYIAMRRDYTFETTESYDNLAQIQGTVNIDLGGYILSTGTVAKPLFYAWAKGYSGAAGEIIFPTTFNISNGTLRHYKSGIVALQTWDSTGDGRVANKEFNFNFTNVTFGFVDNADAAGMIVHVWNPSTKTVAAPYNFTYNDCVFDLRTTTGRYNPTIFNLNSSDRYATITHTVNGGTIIANDPSKVTLVSADSYFDSSITFEKGTGGEYLSFVTSASASAPGGSYTSSEEGILTFQKTKTEGSDAVYTLTPRGNVTLGEITSAFQDKEAYPFAVYNAVTGQFLQGYSTMKAAVERAKTAQQNNVWDSSKETYGSSEVSCLIVLRRNYTLTSSDYYDNYAQIKGELTIDLGGYTLTQGSGINAIFANAVSKGWSGKVFPTTISVKNGNINITKSLIRLGIWATVGNGAMAEKDFTFNFSDVNFGFASGATSVSYVTDYIPQSTNQGYSADVEAPYHFNFYDCDFDLVTNAPSNDFVLFNAAPTDGYYIQSNITVYGGTIKAKSLSAGNLYTVENVYNSSFKFAKEKNGEYTKIYLNNGNTVTKESIPTDNGSKWLARESIGTSTSLYTLSSVTTEYGVIPEIYSLAASYPFVLFDAKTGEFVNAYTSIKTSIDGARSYQNGNVWDSVNQTYGASEKSSVILLRANYSQSHDKDYYENFSQVKGSVVLDLGGFTITQTNGNAIFANVTAKPASGAVFPTTFTVKNGTLLAKSRAVIRARQALYDGSEKIADKTFTWNFDNINFGYAKNASTPSLLIEYGAVATSTTHPAAYAAVPFVFNYTDCNFDLVTNAPSAGAILFNGGCTEEYFVKSEITVKGGNIVASTLDSEHFMSISGAYGGKLTFEENENGNYITLTLPVGKIAPLAAVNNNTLGFVKVSETSVESVYTLAEITFKEYVPKMSLTLDSNLIINVYIPVNGTQKFTFNGKNYENLDAVELEIVTIDGEEYYHVTAELPAKRAAESVTLNSTVVSSETLSGGTSTFTFSIPKYATKILDSEATETEKTLIKDILVYINAAYRYFNNTTVAQIDSIIGTYKGTLTNNKPDTNIGTGFEAATFVLESTPAVRFYLHGNADKDAYKFYVNGSLVAASEGVDNRGAYLEVSLYAYKMYEAISYTVNGVFGGSYHVLDYYEFALLEEDEALIAVVEAFRIYTESARAYKLQFN